MLNSYSENVQVKYVSRLFSAASFLNTIILLTSIVGPYLIVYRMQGLWIHVEMFQEQPKVMFKHDALLILEIKDTNGQQESLIWSTFPGLKSMIKNRISPLITSREADPNFDSINDFLDIHISIPLSSNVSVYGIHMILLFEFRLNKYANLDMESMIYTTHQSGVSANQYQFTGDLKLVQKEPLWNRFVDTRYQYEVIPRFSTNVKDYSLPNIVNGYAYRNVTTILDNKYDFWLNDADQRNEFSIKGRIYYVQQTYECWAGFLEMIKWAWVQYLSIFVIVYAALRLLQRTLYKSKIFETIIVIPWEQKSSRICNNF